VLTGTPQLDASRTGVDNGSTAHGVGLEQVHLKLGGLDAEVGYCTEEIKELLVAG
jgi:hypothetical protein